MLIYVGLRVKNIERSLAFYSGLFGLKEIGRGGGTPNRPPIFVLLQDPKSGQKLELNWYPESSPYAVPYVPGEGLDHVGFKVASVPETLRRLRKDGVKAPRWAAKTRSQMVDAAGYRKVMWVAPNGHRTAYVLDPDGNYVELYDHPELGRRFPVPETF
jgi:catechol 2,3-dioxygenase-like lactoylglutathione lyase family enzyme